MKNVNIKDVEVTEIVEDIKKNKIKNIVLLIIIGIVSLIGFFFLATKVRWDAEIEEYTEILYVGQEEVKVDRLDGFYGEIIEFELKDDLAILMYCESEYGGLCVTGDFNNGFENLLREPSIVINIVILIDLVLLFILLKDKCFGKIKTYVVFSIILLYGFINLSGVIIEVADYYTFVNDSKNLANATIIRGISTSNENEFYPVVTYTTKEGEFTNYLSVPVSGTIKDKINEEITVYYDAKDHNVITAKKSLLGYIVPTIVSILFIVLGIIYLILYKKSIK